MRPAFDPTQLLYNWGLDVAEWGGKKALEGLKGVVSAFQSRGATTQEIKSLVVPLAKSLTYTSRKPKFNRAEGGLQIEHIEQMSLTFSGHNSFRIDSSVFQWLKGIANQFEEYQIQAWYAWNPICPATTTGQVLMAYDYDPTDNPLTYTSPSDYFNTADHCISAIWSPAAIAPQRSAWLKTGTDGEIRLYSAGTLHVTPTDSAAGYLTVKYQVSLRKPQPSAPVSTVIVDGSFQSTTDIYGTVTKTSGNQNLITSINSSTLVIAPTAGWKIVTWSTDGVITTLTATSSPTGPSSARMLGNRTGTGADFVCVVGPATTCNITAVVSLPAFVYTYRVSVVQIDTNPIYGYAN